MEGHGVREHTTLSTRCWVRDFLLSSIVWLVPLLRGFSPPPPRQGDLTHAKPQQLAWVCVPIICLTPMPMCVPLCLQCPCVFAVCCLVSLGQHVNFTVSKQSHKSKVTPSPCQCTKVAQPQPWSLAAGWQKSGEHKCQDLLPSHAPLSSGIHLKSALRPGSMQTPG